MQSKESRYGVLFFSIRKQNLRFSSAGMKQPEIERPVLVLCWDTSDSFTSHCTTLHCQSHRTPAPAQHHHHPPHYSTITGECPTVQECRFVYSLVTCFHLHPHTNPIPFPRLLSLCIVVVITTRYARSLTTVLLSSVNVIAAAPLPSPRPKGANQNGN